MVMQCPRFFLTVDNFSGMQVYSYEGRPVSNPKFQGALRCPAAADADLRFASLCCALLRCAALHCAARLQSVSTDAWYIAVVDGCMRPQS